MTYDEFGNPKPEDGSIAMITVLFTLMFKAIYYGFVYLPIWAASYLLTKKIQPLYGDSKPIKVIMLFIIAYLLYSFVFFLKGLMIVFKVNNKVIWIPIFIVCVIVTCLLPTLISYNIIRGLLRPSKGEVVNNLDYWSALFAIIIGGFIYNKYKFHTDTCPRMPFWSYALVLI
jgi:hypothetical protein